MLATTLQGGLNYGLFNYNLWAPLAPLTSIRKESIHAGSATFDTGGSTAGLSFLRSREPAITDTTTRKEINSEKGWRRYLPKLNCRTIAKSLHNSHMKYMNA